jgi:hypothetical protein
MKSILFTVLLLLTIPFATLGAAVPEQDAEAVAAAERFVALVDQGRYGESWETAARLFTARIARAEWERTVAGVRPPLGAVVRRTLLSTRAMTSAPGAPDGDYVVVLFASAFARKETAVETVTTLREADGQWRVAGYFIK